MSSIQYLTTYEVARVLRRSTTTLERWRTKGTGPRYIKMGGTVLYDPTDIEAFVDEGRRRKTRGEPEPASQHKAAPAASRRPFVPASTQSVSPRLLAKTRPWNVAEHLRTPAQRAAYLEAVFEEGDAGLLVQAICDVSQASDPAGIRTIPRLRVNCGGVDLRALASTLKTLGLQLRIKPSG
ncbi:helix-turn-helix domain-containing protein [Methylopila sp. Yamaguchi]|uniref:helix-turn-helix domain-containing protein n=1 Tax=Methylopila sp. Yamaguchi TaxID=1437817 RepID=UPI000CAF4BCD|nr:helix-turn-helix domain-containing protein [Methylopila sp. Yamaguchi]GBD50254.1 hypothetical protein METY_3467 [Methylopila sp. Yamaguchi]